MCLVLYCHAHLPANDLRSCWITHHSMGCTGRAVVCMLSWLLCLYIAATRRLIALVASSIYNRGSLYLSLVNKKQQTKLKDGPRVHGSWTIILHISQPVQLWTGNTTFSFFDRCEMYIQTSTSATPRLCDKLNMLLITHIFQPRLQ